MSKPVSRRFGTLGSSREHGQGLRFRHPALAVESGAVTRTRGTWPEAADAGVQAWNQTREPRKSSSPTTTSKTSNCSRLTSAGLTASWRPPRTARTRFGPSSEFRPDLILLDMMMPRLSGFEVCRKLRANPETQDTLILMVTALNEVSDFERGVQAGTDDFLTKPVNKLELLCRVKSLLRVRHLKSQLERTLAYLSEVESSSRDRDARSISRSFPTDVPLASDDRPRRNPPGRTCGAGVLVSAGRINVAGEPGRQPAFSIGTRIGATDQLAYSLPLAGSRRSCSSIVVQVDSGHGRGDSRRARTSEGTRKPARNSSSYVPSGPSGKTPARRGRRSSRPGRPRSP